MCRQQFVYVFVTGMKVNSIPVFRVFVDLESAVREVIKPRRGFRKFRYARNLETGETYMTTRSEVVKQLLKGTLVKVGFYCQNNVPLPLLESSVPDEFRWCQQVSTNRHFDIKETDGG